MIMLLKMWLKFILLQILVNYLAISCEQIDRNLSNDLKNLFEKFQQNCQKNSKESKEIKKLSQITTDFQKFESQLSLEGNSSQHKIGFVDERISNFITKVVVNVAKVVDIKNFWKSVKEGISTSLTCLSCHTFFQIIFSPMFGVETLSFSFINICFVLNLSEYDVCKGYITSFKDQIAFIKQNTDIDALEMCALLMGDQCYSRDSVHIYWKLNITEKPNNMKSRDSNHNTEHMNSMDSINNMESMSKGIYIGKQRKRKYKILHITDIHLDLDYVPNTVGECGTPYCCREGSRNAEKQNRSVNFWGSYPCDTPLPTLHNWAEEVDWKAIDWTYWTGDVVPHDSWRDSKNKSLQASEIIINYFRKFSKNKLVVPAIGNHIAVPIGSFPPPELKSEFSISWLYESLAEEWSQWLPTEALESVRNGGFYSLKMRPGFRIIVINTNYCARLNIWTFYNSIDPANHLQWLMDQLDSAEKAGDSVHIVGHLPPDNRECTQSWLYNYMAIIERYSDTIVGQFFGHTHKDEFRVLYSVHNSSKPIGLEIISPSLSTYDTYNPAYRVITSNKNGEIIDMDTYMFDLVEANRGQRSFPKWFHEYSMADTYSIDKFDANTFDGLVKSIDTKEDYLHTFHILSHRNSSYAKTNCDKTCKSKFIYNTVIANPYIQKPKPLIEAIISN